MPIVTLQNLSLAFGTDQILDAVELSIDKGERLAFTGKNGAGKSTLLGVISGDVLADSGSVWRATDQSFVTLNQNLPSHGELNIYDAVASVFDRLGEKLGEYHRLTRTMTGQNADTKKLDQLQATLDHEDAWNINYKIESTLDRLKLDPHTKLSNLSGGWLKRVAIAKSLVQEPDVWILDEPTNHLDVEGVEWLQRVMLEYSGTVLFVSHDRQLMESVSTSVVVVDRGAVTRYNCGYRAFVERRDKDIEIEEEHNKQFDKKLAKEERWIRQSVKARRTRNEGRVRALKALRLERSKRLPIHQLKLELDRGTSSGKIVKEAEGLGKSIGGKVVIRDLDLIIQRGDRIGVLGPNGCGKSTLLKLLLNEIEPDHGLLKTGSKLKVAYFDQVKEKLDQQQMVQDYIGEGKDFVEVNGKSIHVVTYLQNFLFDSDHARAPIHTLSGGEQNRLLLAKLFAQPTNFLVLDEPTNDLDIETLELLEALLAEYDGTVLLVTHDRSFMDNVVSSTLVFTGGGKIQEHVGGYAEWMARETARVTKGSKQPTKTSGNAKLNHKKKNAKVHKRARDIEKITTLIDETEGQLTVLNEEMSKAEFYELSQEEQKIHFDKLSELEAALSKLMNEWEELETIIE